MLSVAEASARILEGIKPLGVERVSLLDAVGRVLARDAVSPLNVPPWTNSAMDGYAVRAEDVRGATTDTPVRLPVVESIPAGAFASRALAAGEAMRIMTGAPLPEGADGVIRVEDTDDGRAHVEIVNDRDAGRNIRRRGEDLAQGVVALAAGTEIRAAQIGVLAAIGQAVVDVGRQPRVAIVGSGDELVDLDQFHEALEGRRIVATNGYTLQALVRDAGGIPINVGIARDDPASLREHFERARGADLFVTTAGVSVGEHDYTRDVLQEMGAEHGFWRVRMRPGAPLGFGMLDGMPWIGLPGNPVSTMVTFELFVRPVIRRMLGHERLFRRAIDVVLDEPVSIGARLMHFLRAIVTPNEDGTYGARLTGPQGSGILTSMAAANALLIVPEDRPQNAAGDRMRAIPLYDSPFVETLAL